MSTYVSNRRDGKSLYLIHPDFHILSLTLTVLRSTHFLYTIYRMSYIWPTLYPHHSIHSSTIYCVVVHLWFSGGSLTAGWLSPQVSSTQNNKTSDPSALATKAKVSPTHWHPHTSCKPSSSHCIQHLKPGLSIGSNKGILDSWQKSTIPYQILLVKRRVFCV